MKIRSVMAENIRATRAKRRISQQLVAEQMTALGNTWVRQTVSDVEREQRELLAKELFALALVLDCSVLDLLNPESPIDYGGSKPIPEEIAGRWLNGELDLALSWNSERRRFDGFRVGARKGTTLGALQDALNLLDDLSSKPKEKG